MKERIITPTSSLYEQLTAENIYYHNGWSANNNAYVKMPITSDMYYKDKYTSEIINANYIYKQKYHTYNDNVTDYDAGNYHKPIDIYAGKDAQQMAERSEGLPDEIRDAIIPKWEEHAEDDEWLIWSYGHQAWWKSNGWGYTQDPNGAGVYNTSDARRIVTEANLIVVSGLNDTAVLRAKVLTTSPARVVHEASEEQIQCLVDDIS